jgi:hypothetical protein
MSGMNFCPVCGKPLSGGGNFCGSCGNALDAAPPGVGIHHARGSGIPSTAPRFYAGEHTIRRIADYERVSGILWLILGIVQVLMIVTIIVGIWNIVAAASRLNMRPMILARDARVPAAYEGVAQLIIIGILNLLLGGVIGVLFVVFDFIIRDMVLGNRHLFDQADGGMAV